jgi:hypothetical protein
MNRFLEKSITLERQSRSSQRRASRSGNSLFAPSYAPFVAACSSRAYCAGGRPTCRVKATLKVLAEL